MVGEETGSGRLRLWSRSVPMRARDHPHGAVALGGVVEEHDRGDDVRGAFPAATYQYGKS